MAATISAAFLRFPLASSSSSSPESQLPRPGKGSAPVPRRLAVSTDLQAPLTAASVDGNNGVAGTGLRMERERTAAPYAIVEEEIPETERYGWKEYFQQAEEMIRSDAGGGGGGPRWFSPLDCGSRLENSPLLLFLPGIDGVGLGLIRHYQRLGKIFDVWCLHIPVKDRTSFTDLVKMVEETVQSENLRFPNRPIYLVGESLGACLALAVAARNPRIDLALIIANPATSFKKSQLEPLLPLLELMPEQPNLSLPLLLSLMRGDSLSKVISSVQNGLALQQVTGNLPLDPNTLSSYLSVLNDMLPKETLLWKLKMFKDASNFVNSRLHAVKAQTLILISEADNFLPSKEDGDRMFQAILNSDIRKFNNKGHFLFMEEGFDLVTTLKSTRFYRRQHCVDHVSDYLPPTLSEAKAVCDSVSWVSAVTSPVMLSTLENGKLVRGLEGIPSEGPVLFVGYHMLLGLEIYPLVSQIFTQRNTIVRGVAHPMMFGVKKSGPLPTGASYDMFRIMGAVPVSASNLYKLFASKSYALLYPGGVREALHRKGEEYKLFWPEQSEFVRMAARFGTKIVPFGVVGEDDIGDMILDYNDASKIPFYNDFIERTTEETIKLRTDAKGEVANQQLYMPVIRPKVPGRFYFYFGKPIDTAERKQELKDRDKCHELYKQVQSEVENCIAYLKEKREHDPYRNLFSRVLYHAANGITAEVPTFDLD